MRNIQPAPMPTRSRPTASLPRPTTRTTPSWRRRRRSSATEPRPLPHAREVLQREPAFTAQAFIGTLHYRNPTMRSLVREGLLKAGLPDLGRIQFAQFAHPLPKSRVSDAPTNTRREVRTQAVPTLRGVTLMLVVQIAAGLTNMLPPRSALAKKSGLAQIAKTEIDTDVQGGRGDGVVIKRPLAHLAGTKLSVPKWLPVSRWFLAV